MFERVYPIISTTGADITNQKKQLALSFTLFLILFITLGFQAIAVMDDFWHASFIVKHSNPILAPFTWSYGQYKHWTGRVVTSLLQGIFTFSPLRSHYVSALNAVLFSGALFYLFKKEAVRIEEDSETSLQLIIALTLNALIFNYSVLGEGVFWAASVYVWPFVFLVACAYMIEWQEFKYSKWVTSFVFFSLGNANELLVLPVIILFWNNKGLKKAPYAIAFGLGVLVNLLSPGQLSHLSHGSTDFSLNLFSQFQNGYNVLEKAFYLVGWNFLLSVPIILMVEFTNPLNGKWILEQIKKWILLAMGSIIVIVPLFGFATNRVYLYFLLFLSISFFWVLQWVKYKFITYRASVKFRRLFFILSLAVGNLWLVHNILDAAKIRKSFLNQQKIISEMSVTSKNIVTSKHLFPMSGHLLFYSDLSGNPDHWNNRVQAKYYGVDQLSAR